MGVMLLPLQGEEETFVVLVTDGRNGTAQIQSGNPKLAQEAFSPASTFKIVLSWAGLEAGLATPETTRLVNDRHVPGTPRQITLQEAMFYSSNEYFMWMGEQLGREKLVEAVNRSGFFPEPVPADWPGKEGWPWAVIKGGDLKVTPQQEHAFITRVALGRLASLQMIQDKLLQVMQWPKRSEGSLWQPYGKTGVWGGAVWFNGFWLRPDDPESVRCVTVFQKGGVQDRDACIDRFYALKPEDSPAAAAEPAP